MLNIVQAGTLDLLLICALAFGCLAGFVATHWFHRLQRKRYRQLTRHLSHVEAQLDRARQLPPAPPAITKIQIPNNQETIPRRLPPRVVGGGAA